MPVAVPVELNAVDDTALEAHEKRLIAHALATAKGNQSEAARSLRIGRDALRYKIIKHGLDVPGARKAATG
jgi:DNA-binding NtrC family response regulator